MSYFEKYVDFLMDITISKVVEWTIVIILAILLTGIPLIISGCYLYMVNEPMIATLFIIIGVFCLLIFIFEK